MEVISPITGRKNVVLEKTIHSQELIEKYRGMKTPVDVARFFEHNKDIQIYRCLDTGYRFYYPFNITGDDKFYQQLEKFSWYYMDWKWEHGIAEKLIKKGDKVLEIGCAKGAFLKKIREKGARVEGLEMNSAAMVECKKNGLSVYPETIEKFSIDKKNIYDVVCSFQVLEHVADVKNFIESSLSILKPGGIMIISVPNNDSFILRDLDIVLDMPPHHMGLWNINSLIKLQNYFSLTIQNIFIEPLQSYHCGFARKYVTEKLDTILKKKIGKLKQLVMPFMSKFIYFSIYANAENMIGQTVLATYQKIKNEDACNS
jgi:2-polyprenyl-3-methyl-5-hydroxy-6-metoxy-1,4-benzoquinol methylase